MNNKFINEIRNISENIIEINVNLKNLNTMKLDGIVKYLIRPSSFIELKKVLNIINKNNIKYYVIGNGSNIIFTNKEKECLIKLNFIKRNKNILLANEFIPKVAYNFYKDGYEGLQYIAMIPASVGGAIVMNAGAYNHSISDIIEYVYYWHENLKRNVPSKEQYDKMCQAFYASGRTEPMPIYEDIIRPFNVNKFMEFTDVWTFENIRPYKGKHPAEKPVKMLEHAIISTSYTGDIVLDCFAGSGSTAVAALKNGRKSVSIEIDPQWTDQITELLDQLSRVNPEEYPDNYCEALLREDDGQMRMDI